MRTLAQIAFFCLAGMPNAAWALGLGDIQLYSALNQPLRAEIPLFAVKPGEAPLINARLASDSAFERAGIEQADVLRNMQFRVVEGATSDQAVLQVTTAQPIREPFVSMMLEVSWPDGRMVREYTLLLDPPIIASGKTSRRPMTSFDPFMSAESPADFSSPPREDGGTKGRTYGPVREQETLWSIAYALRADDSISMNQMMQAIYDANPEAFDGSITRLRAGSMLRIPPDIETRSINAAQVRSELAREHRAGRSGPPPIEMDESTPPAPSPSVVAAEPARTTPATPQGELKLSPTEDQAAASAEPAPGSAKAAPQPEGDTAAPAPVTEEPAKVATPLEIRDNSAKALELLASHAREHSARQMASEQLTAETTQAAATPPPDTAEQTPEPVTAEAPPPEQAEPATAAPTKEEAEAASPFVDEPAPAETTTAPETTTGPATPPETRQPPTSVDVTADAKKPPAAPAVDDALPTASVSEEGFNPLLLGLAAGAALLLALAAVRLRKYQAARKATVQIAPIVLSQAEGLTEPPFDAMQEKPAAPRVRTGDALEKMPEPAVARTVERTFQNTLQRTLPPEQTTRQFMAVSTPESESAMPIMAEQPEEAAASDPYADALGEVDIHIAYGLYDEAARLLQEPLGKSPERKDLHLKLLEVYFSANMAKEFEAQASKMRKVVTGDGDPDWEKACIMGNQLCPDSKLFAGGGTSGGGLGTTADLDISSMVGGTETPGKVTPAGGRDTATGPDLDLSGIDLGVGTGTDKPAAPALGARQEASAADSGNTLDFNLEDFKLDAPAEKPPAAEKAKPAPDKPEPAQDDNLLDIDLSDFDVGVTSPAEKETAPEADKGDDVAIDDLLSPDLEAGEGQADTRLDLARAYIDMGEPAMAQSLLEDVIAQGDAAQKQEAEELLGRLGSV